MRFEDAMVVCEDTNGKEYVIQKKKIPEEATEGNVIKKYIRYWIIPETLKM